MIRGAPSACLLAALLALNGALADERILAFHSDIVVAGDGWIEVTETIRVRAEGSQIRRGIYRDFPTEYEDRFGNEHVVDYRPLAVLRDDAAEDFHSVDLRNGVRTYFGSADRYLDPGVYSYSYRYRANRMLGFFAGHDELYWNVTGNGWAFPIDAAGATVTLDFGGSPEIVEVAAYTGFPGAAGEEYEVIRRSPTAVTFSTTRPLLPHEGLTIAVAWPKGFVEQPGALQIFLWQLRDNVNLLAALLGLAALLAYFVPVWRAFGRDPEEGLLVTRYEPPAGFSPASLRFIQQMYYDSKVMTSAVLNLAVKGYLRIEDEGEEHSLVRVDPGADPPALATGEQTLLEKLFRKGDVLPLDDAYHERIGGARRAHARSLKRDYAGRYFRTNGLLSLPGLVIAVIASLIALNVGRGPTPFVIAAIVAMVITFFIFAAVMKRPTGLGRKLLDELLGFRDYLEIAEKDEMNLRNPPQKTPQLFERYLPFALAMGVEQKWAEKFADVLASLRGPGQSGYRPGWYNGSSWSNADLGGRMSALASSLDGAISSSATPPGSSSGGGGGGSSGGGGGGGGGGGW